jgi:pimeloyl-ACP methyl ester carboxylesterase
MGQGPGRHRAGLALAAAAVALAACTSGPSGTFTVNGHDLHLECGGGPGPTVVFEAAVGGDHSLWPIAERIRDRALACVYDRAGNGESGVPEERMTAETDVADLHALMVEANVPRPVVIVGHSYGTLVAWIEAAEHPDDVVGLVLIDGTPPSGSDLLESVLTNDERDHFHDAFVDLPNVDFLASLDQAVRYYAVEPDMPVTLITATNSMQPWCEIGLPCDKMQGAANALADEFAADHASTRYVKAATSHYVHEDDPDLVVREILRVLDLVESP